MTPVTLIPEWVKVKVAAVVGIGTPIAGAFVDYLGPVLDALIKFGQLGVALVTILYIWTKWRNARRNKK